MRFNIAKNVFTLQKTRPDDSINQSINQSISCIDELVKTTTDIVTK